MLLQAHRGVSTEFPENTIPAFQAAYEQGYAIIELDPKFTKDGKCVTLHDYTLNRTCRTLAGEPLSDAVNIGDVTYEELSAYDAGIFMGEAFRGTKIPLLTEALAYGKQVGIPMKIDNVFARYPETLQEQLFDEVEAYGGEVGFTCGDLETVKRVVARFPDKEIHYDGPVDEEKLLAVKAALRNNPLTIWVPMKNELTHWVKIPFADEALCAMVKRHARLGLWILEKAEQLAEAERLGADIVETTGSLKP